MLFHLIRAPRVVKITETESRMVAAGGGGREGMEHYCLMGTDFQIYKMKRVLEMDGGDGCTAL